MPKRDLIERLTKEEFDQIPKVLSALGLEMCGVDLWIFPRAFMHCRLRGHKLPMDQLRSQKMWRAQRYYPDVLSEPPTSGARWSVGKGLIGSVSLQLKVEMVDTSTLESGLSSLATDSPSTRLTEKNVRRLKEIYGTVFGIPIATKSMHRSGLSFGCMTIHEYIDIPTPSPSVLELAQSYLALRAVTRKIASDLLKADSYWSRFADKV